MRLMATLLPFSMADHSLCMGTLCYLFSAYNLAQTEISIKGACSMASCQDPCSKIRAQFFKARLS